MGFVEELSWRGLVVQASDPEIGKATAAGGWTLYCGFDPTASSLHVGSLLPILALRRAQLAGHRPIALVGGATGMIGDPSGKTEERKLQGEAEVEANVAGIRGQLERFLDFGAGGARLRNNAEWMRGFSYLGFLREVGKLFSVNMMLGKDSVRSRLEDRDHGISYTEFSYMLIQAYDFLHLFREEGCRMQIGGSDQWGNMTAGIDLIRRVAGGEAHCLTLPLVTTAAGQKFGKTEKGAVWLDPARTSPYEFFQFFMQTEDRDVVRFLRYYTFLSVAEIAELEVGVASSPERREAQRVLAREVTKLVHGEEETRRAEQATAALFEKKEGGGGLEALDEAGIEATFANAPSSEEARSGLGEGLALIDLLVRCGLCPSRGAARREIEGGGIYVNDRRVTEAGEAIYAAALLRGRYLVLRKGKRTHHLVRFV